MVAGIVFVIFFVVGAILTIGGPTTHSSDTSSVLDQKWITWLSSSNHRVQHVVGAYLLILGGIAFVWFCQGLRARLEATAPAEVMTGRFVGALSVAGAGAMAAAAMTAAVIAGAVLFGGENAPTTGDAAHWISDLTFPFLFVVFGLTAAAIIASLTVAASRSAALPRWAVPTGWLAVLGSLAGVIFIPFVLPMLWFLAVAISGLRAPAASPAGS